MHPNVLPQPGEAVAPPCANASAEALSLFVRQTTDFYKDAANSWMELDKSYSAAATAQTVQTIYQPKEIPPSFVARHADDHTKILNDFSTLGFAVVSDGLPDGWDSQMRDYLLQFRSRLSSQAWGVSPEFRGHTTYYMKKPGMRTNLALSMDEGPVGGKKVGEVFAEMFRKTPALRQLFPDNAVLSELGAFLVFPGADPQIIHQDINYYEGQPKPRALFLQLGDTTPGMENLRVWPGTHPQPGKMPANHASLDGELRQGHLRTINYNHANNKTGAFQGVELGPVNSRSAIIYDARLFHHGTANVRDKPRVILYLTAVMGEDDEETRSAAKAWSLSLIPEYKEKGTTIKEVVDYVLPKDPRVGWLSIPSVEQCIPNFQMS